MNTLTEIWGPPGVGKSHMAIEGWPDPLVVDTAFTSLGFRQAEVDQAADERGETWPVHLKLHDYDEQAAESNYHYLGEWPEGTEFAAGYSTVILDNAADLRVLAVNAWAGEHDSDWPQQSQWGEVNDKIDWLLRRLKADHHVVVISQMKDEYRNDAKTGDKTRDGPKRMEYKADFRLKLDVDDDTREAQVMKNRHLDSAGDEFGAAGTVIEGGTSLEDLLLFSQIPEEQWDL